MPDVAPAAPAAPIAAPSGTIIASKPATPPAPAPKTAPVAAKAEPGTAPEAEKPEESIEITVDGAKRRVSAKEAEKLLGKSAYADKVISQAKEALRASQAQEAERIKRREAIKTDKAARDAFLKEHGIEPEAYAREILEAKVAEGRMTPEQRQAAELAAENTRIKAELETRTRAETEQKQVAAAQQLQKQVESELSAAAQRAGIEPGSESFFAIYEALQEAYDLGLPWDPERIIEVAKENMDGAASKLEAAVLKGLKGDALLKRLGEPVVKEVVAARWAQIQAAKNGGGAPAPLRTQKAPAKQSPYITVAEAREQVKKLGGR
jgi:hypothetical protein